MSSRSSAFQDHALVMTIHVTAHWKLSALLLLLLMRWTPAGGTRRRGHPKKTWRRTFQEDLGWVQLHLTWNEAEDMASDRSYCRQAAAQCALQHGRN